MPRGIPNPNAPAPMILIEPAGDAIRLNAYGLDPGQIVDLLRRTLLHVVATHSGVQVISLDVPPAAAVVASKPPARASKTSKPKAARPSANGRPSVPTYSLAELDLDDDEGEDAD